MAGTKNDTLIGKNADFSQAGGPNATSGESNGLNTNGQMWIGSTAVNAGGTHINVGSITSPGGTLTIGYSSPNITLELAGGAVAVEHLTGNTGGQLNPTANNFNILGATVAAGTSPLVTAGAGSTITINAQRSQALASADSTKVGLSNFNSAQFQVDANGFVTLSTTGSTQTLTGNSGTATPVANNINVITANATVKFVGSGATLTQDFGLTNLLIGSPGSAIAGAQFNVSLGNNALAGVTSGQSQTCIGSQSGFRITTGTANTLIGADIGINITSGNNNTGIGSSTLPNLTTGSNNLVLGCDNAGSNYSSTESNNIILGNAGTALENNVLRIGTQGSSTRQQNKCFIAGIVGVTNSNPQLVTVNSSTGQLGVTNSSQLYWNVVTTNQTGTTSNGYICVSAGGALTISLPTTSAVGDEFAVVLDGATSWQITQAAGQQIRLASSTTTLGATGSLTSTAQGNAVKLVCRVANTTWTAISSIGNITVA